MSPCFQPVGGGDPSGPGPYKPVLILHGGAGAITRSGLPHDTWLQYRASLLSYLESTRLLLDEGASALDAACRAVCLFEDDPLFNCGRGSVFTERGTIEMEASVMVSSIHSDHASRGSIKRGAAVSLVRNTRHPILLARELLLDADRQDGLGGTATMHCHLSGPEVEQWGWTHGLEQKDDEWFWTRKRWEEHRRGLGKPDMVFGRKSLGSSDELNVEVGGLPEQISTPRSQCESGNASISQDIPSQGTVGAVCMDSWGNLAVATSTGGLTNKKAGRIGDTPTIGAGFWAESWEQATPQHLPTQGQDWWPRNPLGVLGFNPSEVLRACIPLPAGSLARLPTRRNNATPALPSHAGYTAIPGPTMRPRRNALRRAIAVSGTGNGDSFLRTNAARTVASLSRFSPQHLSLQEAVTLVAGPGGELEKSAGERWGKTGEGQGGIIGIEIAVPVDTTSDLDGRNQMDQVCEVKAVFDFNCGGLFRAYYETIGHGQDSKEVARAMVFKEDY